MILVIRGHIRDSFNTKDLYNLIKNIYVSCPDLKIFIHTWNIFASNVSWRKIPINNNNVTNETIYNYFGDLKACIKHIIIDNDKEIQLIGNLLGNVGKGPMPVIGWKNYWYGKYKIIDYIYNNFKYDNEMIVNIRFDILKNSNSFNEKTIINFINNNKIIFNKNIFLFDKEICGIDNIYIGNINTMHKLSNKFFYELDDIIHNNKNIVNQEKLVFIVNKTLFE
jgi:hypothetical protein